MGCRWGQVKDQEYKFKIELKRFIPCHCISITDSIGSLYDQTDWKISLRTMLNRSIINH